MCAIDSRCNSQMTHQPRAVAGAAARFSRLSGGEATRQNPSPCACSIPMYPALPRIPARRPLCMARRLSPKRSVAKAGENHDGQTVQRLPVGSMAARLVRPMPVKHDPGWRGGRSSRHHGCAPAVRENHLSVEQMAALGITHQSIAARMATGDLGCWVAEEEGAVVGFSMADRVEARSLRCSCTPRMSARALAARCWPKPSAGSGKTGHRGCPPHHARGTRAFAFYGRKGWQPTGQPSASFDEDEVMEKRLR